ncbi:MAG: S49 family peptidase, partial [Caulobacteraceae bacterium]|nr:S49 family peptidase [Caulobacteraceae bacterium]
MKQFLITVAGVFVGLALFMIGVPILIVFLVAAAVQPAPMTGRGVLVLDLRGALADQEAGGPLAFLEGKPQSVMAIEEGLRRAEGDDRVKGLFVRLPEGGMAPAAADELRLAFKRFRASGKPILAHGQGLYAEGMAVSTYELAAASGDVWMQPGSAFQATGAARQDIFFKRLFDRHGVAADYQQRYEYKTAVNPYLYSDYTAAHRESEQSWMGSVYQAAVAAVAADRGQAPSQVAALIEAGPYLAEDARAKGLIGKNAQPLTGSVAAVSVGVVKGAPVLDLDYP